MKFNKPGVAPKLGEHDVSSNAILGVYQDIYGSNYYGIVIYLLEGGWFHTSFHKEGIPTGKIPPSWSFIGWAELPNANKIEFI